MDFLSKIAKQANNTPEIHMNRSFGPREGEYSLICYTDSSAGAYGCVIYIKELQLNTVSFVTAKNRILSASMKRKTMPSLELQGIEFGVECMMDAYNSLTNDTVVLPINIVSLHVFSDSSACLHWLESYSIRYEKMQKQSVFVINRLAKIETLCNSKPVSSAMFQLK